MLFRSLLGLIQLNIDVIKPNFKKMKKEKKIYEAPTMEVQTIELEQGIAAGSGGTGTPNPGVGDWGNGSGGEGNGDL